MKPRISRGHCCHTNLNSGIWIFHETFLFSTHRINFMHLPIQSHSALTNCRHHTFRAEAWGEENTTGKKNLQIVKCSLWGSTNLNEPEFFFEVRRTSNLMVEVRRTLWHSYAHDLENNDEENFSNFILRPIVFNVIWESL